MNYVGSISIIDRGDAPAKAIIDKNVRSMAQRVADETKEELNKVMDRVDKLYVSYEMATQTVFDNPRGSPNVEYIEDIKELEEILSDTVKKKKYQQQVTVFVVGFQNVSAQKMQLLQQVNQFFLDNSKGEEEEVVEERLQIDLDEASKQVHESLNTAEELTKRLSDLNQDIIEWLVNYANTKASNKNQGMIAYEKGKKRLEKNLEAAKQDITDLSEKLLKLQTELEEKDEKFQLMSKQLDVKTQEAVRYKTAADVAKKSASDNEAHTTMLHEEIKSRDEKIVELRKKISRMEINLTESQFDTQLVSKRLDNTQAQTKEKLAKLQEEVENKKIALSEAERVMDKLHKEQLTNLTLTHKQEIEELKNEHQEQLVKLTEQLKLLQEQLAEYETKAQESYEENEQLKARVIEMQLREPTRENVDITHLSDTDERLSDGKSIGEISGAEDEASRQESKASTTAKAAKKPDTLKPSKTPVRSKSPNRLTQKTGKKDGTEVSAQDDGLDPNKAQGDKVNDPSRQASRLSKNLDPVLEGDGAEFPNAFDLHDEASWSAVPPAHVPGRFLQYRQLTVAKVKELEEQLQVTLTKTHRKVNSLKSQFTEHKGKWEAERKILFEQVEQAQKLQTDAEKEADAAITQLEEFINEQEKLEDEEEEKRQEIIKSLSRPGTTRRKKSVQETKPLTPDEKGAARGERLETEHSDQELKNLMQQTDDAKAQEKNARQTGAISAPPAVQPQKYETPREDYESQPVTPKHKRISNQSESTQDHQELASLPKQAFTTPRPSSLKESQEKNVEISRLENPEMDHKKEEEIPLEIFEAGKERLTRQSLRSLHDLKTLSLEDVLTPEQQKAFDKLRTVVRRMSSQRPNRPFDEAQLERTISILSIASQIAAESAQLGGLPGGIFESFDKKDARLVSPKSSLRSTTNSRSKRSHTSGSKLEEKEPLHETAELIVEIKDSKAVTVQEIDEKISKEKIELTNATKQSMETKPKKGSEQSSDIEQKKILEESDETQKKRKEESDLVPKKKHHRKHKKRLEDGHEEGISEVRDEKENNRRSKRKHEKKQRKMKKTKEAGLFKSTDIEDTVRPTQKMMAIPHERVLSGSDKVDEDLLSPRPDTFSASLPKTPTSSELRKAITPLVEFLPKVQTKPLPDIAKRDQHKNKSEQLSRKNKKVTHITQQRAPSSDRSSHMSSISVVISPLKKSRPVTMQEMLFGKERTLHHVEVTDMDLKLKQEFFPDEESEDEAGDRILVKGLDKDGFRSTVKFHPRGEKGIHDNFSKSSSFHHTHVSKDNMPLAKSQPIKSKQSTSPVIPASKSPPTQASNVAKNISPRTTATPGTLVSDINRPVSIATFNSVDIDNHENNGFLEGMISEQISKSPNFHVNIGNGEAPSCHKETQTDEFWSLEREPISGNTEEEVRQSSAKSRASLRNQFKSRLDETKHAVESRRTKSPLITLPAQKSVDDELIIESDDEDLPIPDELKEEALQKEDMMDAGMSPPPDKDVKRQISMASRKSTNLADHPLVQEYLRAYTGIHNFKEAMSRVLIDKDQMSASQLLTELGSLSFDKEDKVIPQISNMTENIYYVLNEISQVINSVIQNDRGPVVSSLMIGMTRDNTQRTILREKSGATDGLPMTQQSQRPERVKSASTDRQQYKDLQDQYEKLLQIQNHMADESKKYEEQQQRNMVAMMEMQDTINHLQRELSALGKQSRRPASESVSTAPPQQKESAIMFTRLDSERNAKIMKKAVHEDKLDPNRYKEAVGQMEEYVSLPAQRLSHLVRKYVHYVRMKEIEANVQKSESLNENVFEILDKMEALQSRRAKRWTDRMDVMGMERYRLANMLMETLDGIEQESGIFLIKPMYSYRGREPKDRFSGKISRPFRPHRTLSPLRDSHSAYAPAPTPMSNVRPARTQQQQQYTQPQSQGQGHRYDPSVPLEGNTVGLMGSSVVYVGTQPQATWSMSDSQIGISSGPLMGNLNTPRILELDINRMMIGQNTISAQIGGMGLSNDRLTNAANSNLRSYVTVNRPGQSSAGKSDRPRSGTRTSPVLSTSPTSLSSKRLRMSTEPEIPVSMATSQPLPPIGRQGSLDGYQSGSSRGRTSPHIVPVGNELPDSPSGSSLRQSPMPYDAEI